MPNEVEDAKVGSDSSPSQDATPDSSTGKTTTADSSSAGAKDPSSLSEALEGVKLDMPPEDTADAGNDRTEQQPDESPSTETETGKSKDGEAAPKDGQAAKTDQAATDSDAPFHTRPEWQKAEAYFKSDPKAAEALKPILRQAFQAETRANEALREARPAVETVAELERITGGKKEWQAAQNVMRGFSAGDPAVLPILRQMVQMMERTAGEVVHSPDLLTRSDELQKQLETGMIDQAQFDSHAELLKEVERNRAAKSRAEAQAKATTQAQQQQAVTAQTTAQVEAVNSWESNIRQRDPDFGDVTDVNDPKHGESVADQVFDAMSLKFMHQPNATTEQLLAAAQRAYDMARKRVPGPAPRQSKVVTSQSSSVTGRQRPRTMREAMDAVKLE